MSIKSTSYRYLLIFLLGLLLVSLLGNFLLYQELKATYLGLYQVSLNPLGINRYNNQQAQNLAEQPRVIFYGDSRAFQWKAPEIDTFEFMNRGISGQTSAQVLERFEAHITDLKPKIIVLQVGINDLRMLPSNSQTREDIVRDCQDNIFQIVERANNLEANIIVTTIFPLGKGNIPLRLRPFWHSISEIEQSINEVNEYIRTISDRPTPSFQSRLNSISDQRIVVFDAYSLLNQEDPNKVKYYKDLLHLNRKGYQLLNQNLKSILNNIGT